MAIESIFYLNAADLTLATAAYLDLALTNLAPDGFYKEGTITRQQSSGILLAAEPCVTCGTPCGTSIGGGGSSGIYTVNLDVGSISGSTGAIRIMFNPDNVPDGIRVTYNGVVYNKLSSPIVGVRQSSNPGHYTIVGTSGGTSSCSSWYPSGGTLTLPVKLYNPATSSFVATGVNQTDVISVGDFFIGTRVEDCWMVIPKTTALPSSLLIEMIGPCTSTGWDFSAYCPAALPTFPASDVFAGATVPCSTPIPNTFYFAKVHLAADTYVGLYDYVFTDVNGQFPLPNGYYLTSNVATPNKVIQVGNGVIIGITDCTTPTVVTIPTLITTAVTNITTTSATSGGESINANNGVISAKGIEWSATQNFASILGSTSNGTGTGNFSSNLTSLTPNSAYWVRSYATNEVGTGYGSPLSFSTSQTVVCLDCIPGTEIQYVTPQWTQQWTQCNLDVTTYRDGTPIPQVTDPAAWRNLTTGAWCYYNNDPANNSTYGKLYNWYAVNNTANGGLAPVGYHVPTDAEWTTLITFLGGETVAGGKMKETGFCHWFTPNTGATNESAFTALPGGSRAHYDGYDFDQFGSYGFWWSSTESFLNTSAWDRTMWTGNVQATRTYVPKLSGLSVRLIKDDIS
jgi:uncharacterized protein (TIGR02145 family)